LFPNEIGKQEEHAADGLIKRQTTQVNARLVPNINLHPEVNTRPFGIVSEGKEQNEISS